MLKTLKQRLDFIGPFDWLIMGILIALFIGAVIGSRIAHAASAGVDWFAWWDGFLQNSGTELLGAFLTFILLELVRGNREKQAQIAAEKHRLIRQMGSPDNNFALEAVRLAQVEGWLEDGSFKGAKLRRANLAGARMWRANFEGVSLEAADLTGANLSGANLTGAILWNANLTGADLRNAIIDGATFEGATLPDGTRLPGRTWEERNNPEPDWRTPFAAWDQAGRPRQEP